MKIENKKAGGKEIFFIKEGGKQIAELVFSVRDKTMIIEHTEVDPDFRNEDVGQSLVEKAVAYAREQQFSVIPQCPFARAIIEKDKSLQDVMA